MNPITRLVGSGLLIKTWADYKLDVMNLVFYTHRGVDGLTLWSPTQIVLAIMLYIHPRGLCMGRSREGGSE